jgi:hypothetical protein
LFVFWESRSYFFKETTMPATVMLSPRLQAVFKSTKILCFGRYAVEVPQEAQLIFGETVLRSRVKTILAGPKGAIEHLAKRIPELTQKHDSAEVMYAGAGALQNTLQLRYFESKWAKKDRTLFFETYVSSDDVTFLFGDATEDGETEDVVIARQLERAKSVRLRTPEEVPAEPGLCIERGFLATNSYGEQEMASAGVFLPSFPDVTFSFSSNKDAYSDYPKADFEKMKRDELHLLSRIKGAQELQGTLYPKREVLREGKRDVQHWDGEESLIRRPDGSHDFEWAFVGTPKDVTKPSELGVTMFSKVEHNMVGAAKKASVSDDEAVALWDKMLSGLKFRYRVPGVPETSYFLPPSKAKTENPQ